ncbi:TlpA family protein disulfide reductase [Sinanaerobacter chloroacetimidivorans]|nr:TlpA disulfide reductase family protein [Sinanaerobacter chloroacetimidivorans]
MRKIIILLLMGILLSAGLFTGCGGQDTDQDTGKNKAGNPADFTSFQTTDIYGNEINQDIFKDYDLTMINVWGTFCGPCVEEMPFLGELQKEYKEKGVNIVGIVVDVQDNNLKVIEKQVKLAKEITETTGADYTHMIVSPEMIDAKLGEIASIPATFFVDSKGNFVGETYIGSREKKDWTAIIEEKLGEE